MSIGPPLRVLAVAALAVIALIALVAHEVLARQTGAEALLKMEAVDPRALLSGHYVQLSLRETVPPTPRPRACPAGPLEGPLEHRKGAPPSWIALVRNGDHVSAGATAPTRAAAAAVSPLVVRGDVTCQGIGQDNAAAVIVDLDLGVAGFHASQEEAKRIEQALAQPDAWDSAYAVVSIGRDGRARLVGLVIKGQRTDLALF